MFNAPIPEAILVSPLDREVLRSHSLREVRRAMRIVSLLPSATEMVCCLGLEDHLVGVTHECDFPPSVQALPKVTRTLIPENASSREIDSLVRDRLQTGRALYSLDLPILESLRPDLVVTQTLCNVCAVADHEVDAAVRGLARRPQVLNLEPTTLEEVLNSILQLATAAGESERGQSVVSGLRQRIKKVAERVARVSERPGVVLLEWIDPPFSCGHWNPELVRLAGGNELLGRDGQPSRTLAWQEVLDARPEVLVIACCGFTAERARQDLPCLETSAGWESLPCVQTGRVHLLDGSAYFNRPGPGLVDSLEILSEIIHAGSPGQSRSVAGNVGPPFSVCPANPY